MQRIHPLAALIGLLLILSLFTRGLFLSPLVLLVFVAGGGYLLYQGLRIWSGRALNSERVTYWRGQRIELPAERRQGLPPMRAIGPALPYLIGGGAIVLVALAALVG